MKLRPLPLAISFALSVASAAVAQPSLPTLDVSTMLFQMVSEGTDYANTLDPLDVNAIVIDFGDDDAQGGGAIDALLQGR